MTRWTMACAAAVLGVWVGGCGSKAPEPAPPEAPSDLLAALGRCAGRGDIEGIMDRLSDEARGQTGTQWIAFIRRTSNNEVIGALNSFLRRDRATMERASTEEFLKAFQAAAPEAFGNVFRCYYQGHVEEDGQVLLQMLGDGGYSLTLALARQDDGTLRLLGEAEFKKVVDKLGRKLSDKIRQEGP